MNIIPTDVMTLNRLKDFSEVIAWFDSGRWSQENQKYTIWQPDLQIQPSQELLTHWLTYITDIQRPWQEVWKNGRSVFREICKTFSQQQLKGATIQETEKKVITFLNQYRDESLVQGKVRKFRVARTEYTPRFPNQHEFIERTLTILAHEYESDFIKFLGQSIQRRSIQENGLHYIAYDLYLLTYSNDNIEAAIRSIKNPSTRSFDYKQKPFGHKRLWAAMRDYRKGKNYLSLLKQGLSNILGQNEGNQLYNVWTTSKAFDLALLELPGDIWNIKFMEKMVQPLAIEAGIPIKKSWGSSYNARQIYNKIRSSEVYPEQMDISFDLSAKACENEECDLCPFSMNNFEDICLSNTSAVGKKYCPILLATCSYRKKCNTNDCPIIKNIGKGLCNKLT